MQAPPPVRTAVQLPHDWFVRTLEMDCEAGIAARDHELASNGLTTVSTVMVSESEIEAGIAMALNEFTDPLDDLYPFTSREQLYAAAGQALAALLPAVGTIEAPEPIAAPTSPPRIPVVIAASAVNHRDVIASAHNIAAEIARRVVESDYYAPSAFGADPAETQEFLSACSVTAWYGRKVRVAVHGVSVLDASADGAHDYHRTEVSAAWTDPVEAFVNEVELVLAPASAPSVLGKISDAARTVPNDRAAGMAL